MKAHFQNRSLYMALALSVLIHILVLSGRWGEPSPVTSKPDIPIRLVLTEPLPEKPVTETVPVSENVHDMEKSQEARKPVPVPFRKEKKQVSSKRVPAVKPVVPPPATAPSVKTDHKTRDMILPENNGSVPDEPADERSVVFRRDAKSRFVAAEAAASKEPKRPVITANTRDVGYAMYYRALQKKVEDFGLINFPQKNGVRLYGELTVRIPVYYDGSLFEKEGGPRIEKSSGNAALDQAALAIIRRAAPFGPFPEKMRAKSGGADVWIIITRLKFTQNQGTRSQVLSTVR